MVTTVLAHSDSSINSLTWLGVRDFVLTGGGNDSLVKLHDLSDDEVHSFTFPKEHIGPVNSICVGSDTNFASTAGNSIVIWDLIKRRKVMKCKGGSENNENVFFDSKILRGNLLASAGTDSNLHFHDLRQANRVRPIYSLKTGNDTLTSLSFKADENYLVVGCMDGKLRTIDFRKREMVEDYMNQSGIIHVQTTELGNVIVSENGEVSLVDSNNDRTLFKQNISPSKFAFKVSATLAKDLYNKNSHLFSGSESGKIFKFTLNSQGSLIESSTVLPRPSKMDIQSEGQVLNLVEFLPMSNSLISSSGNGYLHIWDNVL